MGKTPTKHLNSSGKRPRPSTGGDFPQPVKRAVVLGQGGPPGDLATLGEEIPAQSELGESSMQTDAEAEYGGGGGTQPTTD